jgi:hypothetical protein
MYVRKATILVQQDAKIQHYQTEVYSITATPTCSVDDHFKRYIQTQI